MADTYEAFYNGKPLNPNRGLPTMSYAQAEASGLTDSDRLWCRTDGDGTIITADQVPYDSNNSVKDKIDKKAENISITIPNTYTTFDTFCIQLANEIKNLGISNKLVIMDATWTGHDNYYGEALWYGSNYVSLFMYNNDEIYRIFVNVGSGSISTKKKVSFTAF